MPPLSTASALILDRDGDPEATRAPASPPLSLMPQAEDTAILLDEIEVWEEEESVFHILWSKGAQIYYASIPDEPYDLNTLVGRQMLDTEVYASWLPHLREAENPPSSTTFIKYSYYSVVMKQLDGDANLFSQVYAEIDVLEQISKAAHPNIVEYRGCLRRDNLIVGICLRRYPCSLRDLVLGAISNDACVNSTIHKPLNTADANFIGVLLLILK